MDSEKHFELASSGGVEAEAKRLKSTVARWYLIGLVVSVPRRAVQLVIGALNKVVDLFDDLERVIFYFEFEAARKYHALTGIDLAAAAGDDSRYEALHPEEEDEYAEDFEDD